MWTKGNSNLWPNEPPRNGLALPVGVSATVRIPERTLPDDCEKKRERESLFCFQNSNRSNSRAMMATYSSSPHRDWSMAAVLPASDIHCQSGFARMPTLLGRFPRGVDVAMHLFTPENILLPWV